jgi:Leucine-rich repeat (LRR) protein
MKIIIKENKEYDTGIHPEVEKIIFERQNVGDFFEEDRFPNLISIVCSRNQLSRLKINCSSLIGLDCSQNQLIDLELNCPYLIFLDCSINQITELKLKFSFLRTLVCSVNKLKILELECPSLIELHCGSNNLTELALFCPALIRLNCCIDNLINLNTVEFCENLRLLLCYRNLTEPAENLKKILPNLEIKYQLQYR